VTPIAKTAAIKAMRHNAVCLKRDRRAVATVLAPFAWCSSDQEAPQQPPDYLDCQKRDQD
jgi:hypothetical protein